MLLFMFVTCKIQIVFIQFSYNYFYFSLVRHLVTIWSPYTILYIQDTSFDQTSKTSSLSQLKRHSVNMMK